MVQVSLVTAKSRLVPRRKKHSIENKYTIPRLELLGNFLLSKLVVNVIEVLRDDMKIGRIVCWTDSMISLAWIKRKGQGVSGICSKIE